MENNPDQLEGFTPENGDADLYSAIRDGNKEKVEELLKNNENDVNKVIGKGSYLHCAVQCRNVEITKTLLNHGAKITRDIFPPITYINKNIIKLLLMHNEQCDLKDVEEIYLHSAIKNQLVDVIQILIKQGVNVNCTKYNNQTAVQLAFQERNEDVVRCLLESDYDVLIRDKNEDTILHSAANLLNADIMRKIIEKGAADVNAVNKYGQTPLHLVAIKSKIDIDKCNLHAILKLLTEHGADINCKTRRDETPLHCAVRAESIQMVKLLLENGANIDEQTNLGITPLHCAVTTGNKEMVSLLVENKADVNSVGKRDETPLNIAVAYEHEQIAKFLISNGAIVNSGSREDMILHMAAFNRNRKLVQLLLENNVDTSVQYNDGRTALHVAVEYKCIEIASMLLRAGVDANISTNTGDTAIHVATRNECWEIFQLLLKYKVNINKKNEQGKTPLYIAAEKGLSNMISELLNYKPDIKENRLALHYAVRVKEAKNTRVILEMISYGFSVDFILSYDYTETYDFMEKVVINGHLGLAEYLLKFGFDPNSPTPTRINNENCKTFLHLAVENNQFRTAKLLLDHGANINAMDEMNHTPIFYAVRGNNLDIVRLLLHKGACVDSDHLTLFMVISKGNHAIIQEYFKYLKNVNMEDEFGTNALHFAAWNGDEESVQLLIERVITCKTIENLPNISFSTGLESNIQCFYGEDVLEDFRKNVITTPLHIAARHNYSDIVEALLEYGFDVNIKDGCGRTPLHLATLYNNTGVIDVLMEFEADLSAADDSGSTCLDYAYNVELYLSRLFLDMVFTFIYKVDPVAHQISKSNQAAAAEELLLKYLAINNSKNKDFKMPECCKKMQSILENCKIELEILKSKLIFNHVSFYDVLIKSMNDLAIYLLNENFIKISKSEMAKHKFSIYNNILGKRLRRAKEKKTLMNEAEFYFTSNLCLPALLARNIMIYLSNRDLRSVKQAYELSLLETDTVKY